MREINESFKKFKEYADEQTKRWQVAEKYCQNVSQNVFGAMFHAPSIEDMRSIEQEILNFIKEKYNYPKTEGQ